MPVSPTLCVLRHLGSIHACESVQGRWRTFCGRLVPEGAQRWEAPAGVAPNCDGCWNSYKWARIFLGNVEEGLGALGGESQ